MVIRDALGHVDALLTGADKWTDMAARFTRIPRLTLFSGPNCSLCDVSLSILSPVPHT